MKLLKNTQKILLTTLIYGLSSAAWAGVVSNTADIDMTSLKVTSVSGNADLVFAPSYSSVGTTINENEDSSADAKGGPVSLFSDNGGFVSATAAIDEFDIVGQTTVEPKGFANTLAQHELQYIVNGAGDVKISADYNLFAKFTDLNNNENITSFGSVELFDEGSNTSSEASIFNEGSVSDPTEKRGTLDLVLSLKDGDTGYLNFIATSSSEVSVSAVPVPPAIILFSSSLLGLLLNRRKLIN